MGEELEAERIQVVPARLEAIKNAVAVRDFTTLGEITMTDSDHFHDVARRSGIIYLKPASFALKDAIHEFNSSRVRAAFTFDAGPNPFVIAQQEDAKDLLEFLMERFTFDKYR